MSKLMYGISRSGETPPDTAIPEGLSKSLLSRGSIAEEIIDDLVHGISPHQLLLYVTISDGKLLTVHEVRIVRTTNTYESLTLARDLTKKDPIDIPAEVADAGWQCATSWQDAQKMGVDLTWGVIKRAALFSGRADVVGHPYSAEYAEGFVSWLRLKGVK